MIDPKEQANVDQSTAFLLEFLPSMWRGLYERSIQEGFTEAQAIDLLKTYIMSQGSGDRKA